MHIFDIEVFKYDWLIIFKDTSTGEYSVFHNDNAAVKRFMTADKLLAGFNNKHYDNHVLKAILCGADNNMVKEVNDHIISGEQGWDHWFLKANKAWFDSFDIRDDMQMGLSLKAIEGHLGLNIEETSVPFDIDRPLTDDEIAMTTHYCKHDVDTTEKIVKMRKNYLDGKMALGRLNNISDTKSLYSTNAKITAMFLNATPLNWNDESAYTYPTNLKREIIPQTVFDFFDDLCQKGAFKGTKTIEIAPDVKVTYGSGGVHQALPNYQEESSGTRVIKNYDVSSLYPSVMINCGYVSRNIPSAEFFEKVYHDRIAAKKRGDKKTANTFKLCLNTTYGAMLNQFNDLYDPLMGRSVCISGQLYLTELVMAYVNACKSIKIINFNTDGVMCSIEEDELYRITSINQEWETRTGFELEEDSIAKIIQKDVNNYIMIPTGDLYDEEGDPQWKVKGGYLVEGVSSAGAWNINNNANIVKRSLVNYFIHGVPVEESVKNCNDLFQFQIIAKAGAMYNDAYHLVDGEKTPVQKVNRVYATNDVRYGKLYKVKAETDSEAKIASLPDQCIVDNNNTLTIHDIEKQFYIDMAKKRIDDFLGIKPIKQKKERNKKMATTTKKTEITNPSEDFSTLNVWQKLIKARAAFLASGVQKSGINRFSEFKYFELADISPIATSIFDSIGLVFVTTFEDGYAIGTLYNTDIPEQTIIVKSPMRELSVVSATGKNKMNELQGLGAEQTYQRRYLYMSILDITENDTFDATLGSESSDKPSTPSVIPKASTKPATVAERTDAKENLIDKDGVATSMQITSLKKALKLLREADPSQENFIAEIATKTNGFKDIKKKACETLILKVGEMVENAKNGGDE